jgi:hypothetical protein
MGPPVNAEECSTCALDCGGEISGHGKSIGARYGEGRQSGHGLELCLDGMEVSETSLGTRVPEETG